MVVSILPVGGNPLPSAVAGSAAGDNGQPGATNQTNVVQSGRQASDSSANNSGGNSSQNDRGDGGENTQLARQFTQEKVVLPAPPADELITPVAPSDLMRYAQSRAESPQVEAMPTRSVGAEERLNDESLSQGLTPPAEDRISVDVSTMRAIAEVEDPMGVDLRR